MKRRQVDHAAGLLALADDTPVTEEIRNRMKADIEADFGKG
jgi:hypothetical protein